MPDTIFQDTLSDLTTCSELIASGQATVDETRAASDLVVQCMRIVCDVADTKGFNLPAMIRIGKAEGRLRWAMAGVQRHSELADNQIVLYKGLGCRLPSGCDDH